MVTKKGAEDGEVDRATRAERIGLFGLKLSPPYTALGWCKVGGRAKGWRSHHCAASFFPRTKPLDTGKRAGREFQIAQEGQEELEEL